MNSEYKQGIAATALLAVASLSAPQLHAVNRDEGLMLDEDAYRQELEEVVVTGKAPTWRTEEEQQWRPEKFKLRSPDEMPQPRFEWFPRYDRDERDLYAEGPPDRMDEKAAIKIFEWRF
jgi:hypothetical protein